MQLQLTNPLTPKQLDAVRKRISVAKSQLVLKHPFFATLVLQRPIVETDRVPTAAADAKGRIYYNPQFIHSKVDSVDKMMFLLAHETLHIAFLHCMKETAAGRDPGACNIAMDKVINEILITEKVGEFIEGGQRHPGAEKMKWQDLYVEPPEGGGGGGENGGIGDDLIECPDGEPTGAEAEQLKTNMKGELAAAERAAKSQGNVSANISRLVQELVYPKTPWHQILERFMQAFVNTDYSWKRPNRRFVGHGIYLPSLDKQPRMGAIGIILDTSGSIGGKEIEVFQGHVNRIIETCVPERVVVLCVDAAVCGVQHFEPDEYPIKIDAKGGGGTDMRQGWDWFAANDEVDCIVCLTDGYTPWPDTVDTPSVVLSTTDQEAPAHVGETVKFEV